MPAAHCQEEPQPPPGLKIASWDDRSYSAGWSPGGFRPLVSRDKRAKVEADTLHLRNGDKVSGAIETISDGFVSLRSELLSEPLRFPLKNIARILFKDKEQNTPAAEASAIFVNGDSLSIGVRAYDGMELVAQAPFSEEIRIGKQHLAGVMFHRPPRVIYEADFSTGDACGFRSLAREWSVRDGKFGPLVEETSDSSAYLPLKQEGHLRYEWEVSTGGEVIAHAGFFFFADRPDYGTPGDAYFVIVSARCVILYRTIQNNTQHVTSFDLPSKKVVMKFEADYDSRKGTIQINVDGQEAIAGVFWPPVLRGNYIMVTGMGKDRFSRVAVRQVADPVSPDTVEEEKGKDNVVLASGDRLSGKITLVADGRLRLETGYISEPLEVPLGDVSSMKFGETTATEKENLPTIFLRNGDRLSAEVVSLREGCFDVTSSFLGCVKINVNDATSVVFPAEVGEFELGKTFGSRSSFHD